MSQYRETSEATIFRRRRRHPKYTSTRRCPKAVEGRRAGVRPEIVDFWPSPPKPHDEYVQALPLGPERPCGVWGPVSRGPSMLHGEGTAAMIPCVLLSLTLEATLAGAQFDLRRCSAA